MSDIEFKCPHCEQSLDVPEELLGQAVECPSCNGTIQLPEPQSPTATTPKTQNTTSESSPETRECPYCGEDILAKAKKCKHCGELLDSSLRAERNSAPSHPSQSSGAGAKQSSGPEKTEFESHPAMFRNNPIGFVFAIILIIAYGLGLLILLIWWLRCLGTTLTVTNKKTILRKGILSKHTNEVRHSDVRNVQVSQGIFQRIFGVGKIGVASAGHGDIEIQVAGIPNPVKVKNIIDKYRD
jgi:DNA-directed RNA polymerase subunit RPC12/RpoP/membrane protein YdbS with pleckstrin-like domain